MTSSLRASLLPLGLAAACTSPFTDAVAEAPAAVVDGVELTTLALPVRPRVSLPEDCDAALEVAGACVPFRGAFTDAGDLVLDGAPLAVSVANDFEQRLQLIFRTNPRLRSSEGPTASLNLELALGAATVAGTFACADADPLAIDPTRAVDPDRVVLDRDVHAVQIVYHPPALQRGGLASSFGALPACVVRVDELPQAGTGRFRGAVDATFIDGDGAESALVDGRFDVVLDAR